MYQHDRLRQSVTSGFNLGNIERGRHHVVLKGNVTADDGMMKVPILYLIVPDDQNGVRPEALENLLEYFEDHSSMSYAWKKNAARAIGALIDFTLAMSATSDFQKWRDRGILERRLFRGLAKALRNGTESLDSAGRLVDRTRLYWRPLGPGQASVLLSALTLYFRWLGEDNSFSKWASSASTSSISSHPIEALRLAAELQIRRQSSLLGHLKGVKKEPSHPYPFIVKRPSKSLCSVPVFPSEYVLPFLSHGFVDSDGKVDETANLLTHLIFGLGLRKSEAFHLFHTDAQFIENVPWVFFHHPEHGMVESRSGRIINRREYLQDFRLLPRNLDTGRNAAGWKGMADDGIGTAGIWLPIDAIRDRTHYLLSRYLFKIRPSIMAARSRSLGSHPFLLVTSRRIDGSYTGEVGDPYTMAAFDGAWSRAVQRIGKLFDDPAMTLMRKSHGNTPHGARHFGGRFLFTAGVEGTLIQRFLRHRSLESHKVYTRLTPSEINALIQHAAGPNPPNDPFCNLREQFAAHFKAPPSQHED